MHIIQFLFEFLLAPDIEVVETSLPERRRFIRQSGEWQRALLAACLFPSAQRARDFLLQDLQHRGRRSCRWLPDQQVHVFRHDHVSGQLEALPAANLLKNLDETVANTDAPQNTAFSDNN